MNWQVNFPEHEPIANGDPFLKVIVEFDAHIIDHRYNYELMEMDRLIAQGHAFGLERAQLAYETNLLERWWDL